ncbi:uncharacterized protein LOC122371473 [Amphibalanus amphitrite]|uniref:uncharacterized protein LOC122371473 n=1 Tax=Amphibalanus amphitrite TaxID=1232801 RepID=UPI001C92A0CF|nr:uncharacterized protein LOC122371473 [Amphibalanus amphitrite]XP_043203758.1 uncharacterized protein LOC122371473 [Amphibalanus amphitrite]
MSLRLALLAFTLLLALAVAHGQGSWFAAEDTDTLSEVDYEEETDQFRNKRQSIFDEKEELRRNCLRKSRQACCPLLKKDAVKFAACVKGYSWSNKDKDRPGCPNYPRCPGFTRG